MQPHALTAVQTLAVGLLALQLGYFLLRKLPSLKNNYIPAPVIGGLAVALVAHLLRSAQLADLRFDPALQPIFFAGFFASIGFRANRKLLADGLPKVAYFLVITVCLATLQKLLALALSPVLGLSRAAGLLAGSAHMGGMALQGLAMPVMANHGAPELLPILAGMATLSIAVAGCLGGPLYRLLSKKVGKSKPGAPAATPPAPPLLTPPNLLKHLTAYLAVVALGALLAPRTAPYIPAFAGALIFASLWRISDDAKQWSRLELPYINTLGNVSLSICLALAFMSLDFARIAALPAGAYALFIIQTLTVLAIAAFILFKSLGANNLAAMIAAGLPGFAIGAPPSTMATLQNIQEQQGPAPLVTFVVPVVGAWLITFINPWIFGLVASLL